MSVVENSMSIGPASVGPTSVGPARAGQTPILGKASARRRKAVGRMGPWQLVRQIGEGTLTRVYQARLADAPIEEQGADASYAVKALKREWWADPQAIEAQRREAWVGSRVSHPNLAPVLSAAIAAPPFYLVTPYLHGVALNQHLKQHGTLPLPTALWIARQAAQALSALNAKLGMVHGDIKPANLHVGQDGHATLLDLGFCQTKEEARSWADRPVMGTLLYLAPERLTSTTLVDIRSDLYSLGVTLYEMLVGKPPFTSDAPERLIVQHRQERPGRLDEVRPQTPKSVADFVDQLLLKDPMRRPSTPQEVADQLVRLEIESFGLR